MNHTNMDNTSSLDNHKMIYADNAATTKMSARAIRAMMPYMETIWGNPSSLYVAGHHGHGDSLGRRLQPS